MILPMTRGYPHQVMKRSRMALDTRPHTKMGVVSAFEEEDLLFYNCNKAVMGRKVRKILG